jgi:2-polyprenyl-3-methyl-5-hydroxy-6-metoxy-1,4-benzoquinol methylase
MKNISEIKFVEWSESINKDSPNLKSTITVLNRYLNLNKIIGLDIGGGIGKFSEIICQEINNCKITVVDNSQLAKDSFISSKNVKLNYCDFFQYLGTDEKYDFVILKTVLHHFVDNTSSSTHLKQVKGLTISRNLLKDTGILIIEENFYEPIWGDKITGAIIYYLTKLKSIEKITRKLGANTAGEGVRFRSFNDWKNMLNSLDLEVEEVIIPSNWGKSFPIWQKIPLFCKKRFQAILVVKKANQLITRQ